MKNLFRIVIILVLIYIGFMLATFGAGIGIAGGAIFILFFKSFTQPLAEKYEEDYEKEKDEVDVKKEMNKIRLKVYMNNIFKFLEKVKFFLFKLKNK